MLRFIEKDDIVIITSDSNKKIQNTKTLKTHSVFEVKQKDFNESNYIEIK